MQGHRHVSSFGGHTNFFLKFGIPGTAVSDISLYKIFIEEWDLCGCVDEDKCIAPHHWFRAMPELQQTVVGIMCSGCLSVCLHAYIHVSVCLGRGILRSACCRLPVAYLAFIQGGHPTWSTWKSQEIWDWSKRSQINWRKSRIMCSCLWCASTNRNFKKGWNCAG